VVDLDLTVKVGVVVSILVALWVLSSWRTYRDRAERLGRALHLTMPPPPQPSGPPIEQIAADLRRIRTQIERAPRGMPVARMRGWLEAYDDLLVAACQALGVDERIRSTPEGAERAWERERVERLLIRAGLRLRSTA
jgi:hypothetical protein